LQLLQMKETQNRTTITRKIWIQNIMQRLQKSKMRANWRLPTFS